MTKQHKTGDVVGVRVVEDGGGQWLNIACGPNGEGFGTMDRTALVPIPAAMTALEREFIESWFAVAEHWDNASSDRWERAKIALSATRAPVDPWKELEEATEELITANRRHASDDYDDDPELRDRLKAAHARYSAAMSAARAAGEKK